MEQYLQYLLIIAVLTGLAIGAYFAFRNSGLGQFLGNVFGDANGMLNWLGDQFSECSQNGLTSSTCTLGPWIIGGLIVAGLFGILKFASLLKPFLPDGTRKYNEITGTDDADQVKAEYKAEQARYTQELNDGTLPQADQDIRNKLPESLKASYDRAKISERASAATTTRRISEITASNSGAAEKSAATAASDAQRASITTENVNGFEDAADEQGESDNPDVENAAGNIAGE